VSIPIETGIIYKRGDSKHVEPLHYKMQLLDEHYLDEVMKHFGLLNIDELPVVSDFQDNKVIGCIWRTEVISVYNNDSSAKTDSGIYGK